LLTLSACTLLTSVDGLTGGDGGPEAADGAPDSVSADGGGPADAESESSSDGGDTPVACGSAPVFFVNDGETDVAASKVASVDLTNVDAQDALVVAVAYDSFAGVTLTDTQGNAYVPVVGPFDANGIRDWIFATMHAKGGPDTVTATLDATGQKFFEVYVNEFHGLANFDHGASSAGTSAVEDGMTSGLATVSCGNDLIFGWGEAAAVRPGTGFTSISGFKSNTTEYKIVTAPGMVDARATMTGGSSWEMLMAAFRSQ
jgi:hypothetical protein